MEISAEQQQNATVLHLNGRLDLVSASSLRQAIEAAKGSVIVDLAEVSFIDSSGVGSLVAGLKHARQRGGELRIAAAGEQILMVLKLTNINRILRPYETVEEALDGI